MPTTEQGPYTPADLRNVASTGGYAGRIRPEEAAGKIGVERSPGDLAIRTQMDELVKRGQLDPRVAQMLILNPQLGQALFKHQLEAPERQARIGLAQAGQGLRERQFQAGQQQATQQQAGAAGSQNIALMKVLATFMESDPRLAQSLGPVLLQMMQRSGINVGAPGPVASSGVTITRR
jgi:hypothetical protein